MVALEDIGFSYPGRAFISGLNVRFAKERITMLVGPNGCGKSTLIKIASGILTPARGKVLLEGRNIQTMGRKERAKTAAVLFQMNKAPAMTVYDLVLSGRYPYTGLVGGYSKDDREKAMAALCYCGLMPLKDNLVHQLSGGERQRVFFAMAVCQDSDILFLDEPTTYMDMGASFDAMEFICRMKEDKGKTIIAVVHDLDLAFRYGDYVALMHQGAIVKEGAPDEILTSGRFNDVFGVKGEKISMDGGVCYNFQRI